MPRPQGYPTGSDGPDTLARSLSALAAIEARTPYGRTKAMAEMTQVKIVPGTGNRRIPGSGKRSHVAVEPEEAAEAQWDEAYRLARLRVLAEIRDEMTTAVHNEVVALRRECGTSALRLAEVARLSNGTTAKWLRDSPA